MNLSFEDFMKSYYPSQMECVFTNNNWTLSEVVIDIFRSNEFYQQHVRWNAQRFGPFETATSAPSAVGTEVNNYMKNQADSHAYQRSSKQSNLNVESDDEAEDLYTSSAPTRTKRKANQSEHVHGHDTRTQAIKLRRR